MDTLAPPNYFSLPSRRAVRAHTRARRAVSVGVFYRLLVQSVSVQIHPFNANPAIYLAQDSVCACAHLTTDGEQRINRP